MCHRHHVLKRPAAIACAAVSAALLASPAHGQEGAKPAVTPPVVVQHVDAVYPPSALAERKHADVVLTVTVDADGHVSNVEVAASGGADLDEAAIVATRQWTFVPAMRNGRPVASRIRVPFHFAPPAPAPEILTPETKGPELAPQTAVPQQAPAAAAPSGAPPAPAPEEVHVRGRALAPSVGASDFNIRLGALAAVPRKNASELLELAPGIFLSNEGGEGHAEQVFLRGFDAREGQDIEFTVGGVPINESGNLHGNGYADTHFVIPEVVEALRVVEGPFDPRQGNYTVAGSADYQLGLEQRGLTAKYLAGSFGTQRLLLTWGPKGEDRHTFGAAEVYSTDGYGQNRDATRGSAIGQYEGSLGERASYRLTAQGYSTHYHSAGVVREDDFEAGQIGFYDTYDPKQGGDSSRYSVAGDIETRVDKTTLGQQVFVVRRDMRLREDFTGFLLDVQQPLQPIHQQRGDLLDLLVGETTYGARGFARLRADLLGQPQQVEFGYYARGDKVSGLQQRIDDQTNRPYATETDLDSSLGDVGFYAGADVKPVGWVTVRGGVRSEVFTYTVNNLCAVQDVANPSTPTGGASCLTQADHGAHVEANQVSSTAAATLLPRSTLIVGPFGGFSLSANYGQGAQSIDPLYITQDVKTPFATVDAYDFGVSYARSFEHFALSARSIGFVTHLDKDLIFNEVAGRNLLGAGTTRTGWIVALRGTGEFFDQSLNATFVKSTFDDTHLLVPYVPDVVVRSDTTVFSALPVRVGGHPLEGVATAGISYIGPRALPFGERSDDIFTIDASATLTWTNYSLGLVVTNLLGSQYRLGEYNYASNFAPFLPQESPAEPTLAPMRHFTAGAPRGVFGTFAITFGGA